MCALQNNGTGKTVTHTNYVVWQGYLNYCSLHFCRNRPMLYEFTIHVEIEFISLSRNFRKLLRENYSTFYLLKRYGSPLEHFLPKAL